MDNDARKVFNQVNVKNLMIYNDGDLFWRFRHGRCKQHSVVGVLPERGHKYVRVYGYFLLIHELIWIYHHGPLPTKGLRFIDGDVLNTHIENLEPVPLIRKEVSFL